MTDKIKLFVPYPDYIESASVFDDQTLARMPLEIIRILNALHGVEAHKKWLVSRTLVPTTKELDPSEDIEWWEGCAGSLLEYSSILIAELHARDHFHARFFINSKHFHEMKILLEAHKVLAGEDAQNFTHPDWWGEVDVHDAHKGQLYRQSPEHYLFWETYAYSALEETE